MTSQTPEQLKAIMAANIRIARDLAEMSQRDLAVQMDVSEMYVSRWERGVVGPSHANLLKLSAALGRDTGWFYEDRRAKAAA